MAFRRLVTFLLSLLIAGGGGIRFSIDAQVDQIFRIIEDAQTALETSDLKMVMTPSDFNYLVPFTVRMTCSGGLMFVQNMKRIHQEDIYMDAINENETDISAKFTVTEMDFKYEICWLSLLIPVPLWLRGKILQSTYHVTSKISYQPKCEFTVTKASLESYGKMSLNIFNWLPGGLGDALTEMLTRNTQDRIYDTVSQSIEVALMKLSMVYNACVAFPAMGRLTELPQREDDLEEEQDESDDPLLVVVKQEDTEDGLNSEKEANRGPAPHVNQNGQDRILVRDEKPGMQRGEVVTASTEIVISELYDGSHDMEDKKIEQQPMNENEAKGKSAVHGSEIELGQPSTRDGKRGIQLDQVVPALTERSNTDFNHGSHEEYKDETWSGQRDRNHRDKDVGNHASRKTAGCSKPKAAESPPPGSLYEMVRNKVIAEELEENLRLVDGKKNDEFDLNRGGGIKTIKASLVDASKNNEPKAGEKTGNVESVSNTIGRGLKKKKNCQKHDYKTRMILQLASVRGGSQCSAETKADNKETHTASGNIEKETDIKDPSSQKGYPEELHEPGVRQGRSVADSAGKIRTGVIEGVSGIIHSPAIDNSFTDDTLDEDRQNREGEV